MYFMIWLKRCVFFAFKKLRPRQIQCQSVHRMTLWFPHASKLHFVDGGDGKITNCFPPVAKGREKGEPGDPLPTDHRMQGYKKGPISRGFLGGETISHTYTCEINN